MAAFEESLEPLGIDYVDLYLVHWPVKGCYQDTGQIVLRWDLQHGVVTTPKSVNPNHTVENTRTFDFLLTESDMGTRDALDQGKRTGPDPDNFKGLRLLQCKENVLKKGCNALYKVFSPTELV